jgi:exopolysaccharide biosynthesis polyprenyl glycosylphosphotransferase
MTATGTFIRRNFEPVMLSVQVLVDLIVILVACFVGYKLGEALKSIGTDATLQSYQEMMYAQISALIAAVCLLCFHAFGMYSPVKSLLNMEEFKAVTKSTFVAFLVFLTLIVYLHATDLNSSGGLHEVLLPLHRIIALQINPTTISRLTLLLIFGLILVFTIVSRFVSFKVIQRLHARGIGNRNVLIYGAGETGRKLQHKFMLVPTLGLNLVGFVDDSPGAKGTAVSRSKVLGSFEDLEMLVGVHKISEIFVAMPEAEDDYVMRVIAECERLSVTYRVVPRFYHLMAFKVRIESLDSIPLVTRPDRRPRFFASIAKRALDLVLSVLVVVVLAPILILTAILIKRESKGPVFFVQQRIGKDGVPFSMIKFRTMHQDMSGDAPTPRSPYDPRITRIGRWLRRYSLDELPQFFNVLAGDMSLVGPRPEMRFIVEKYDTLQRERLRVKPGITGLWQISYARKQAIHENLDYDLYYIENQSFLLDVVIIALTGFAVVKGTGAY